MDNSPASGWASVLKRTVLRFRRDRTTIIAGGVTFFSILAIFPAVAALVTVYGLFAHPGELTQQLQHLREVLPDSAIDLISEQMRYVAEQGHRALGTTLLITMVASLWSARAGMKALLDALDTIYDVPKRRGYIGRTLLALAFTIAAIAFVLLAMAALIGLPILFSTVGLREEVQKALNLGRWPLLVAALMGSLAVVYRYGPNRSKVRWQWITWGSASATLVWLVASIAFSWYATHFASFNRTYGTLGAVIAFMMWLWVSALVVLAGAQLNAELERQDPSLPDPEGQKPGTDGNDTTEQHLPKTTETQGRS